jgi:ssDNA-binding Zn-finger/Zn-ribbon topoisomerase 1
MGKLDQPAFEAHLRDGCPKCGAHLLEIRSFIDRSVQLMLADPNGPGKWAHDGEKFVDGTYRIACATCAHVVFESSICPRCDADGGLAKALGDRSRLAVPKRCPTCNELELLAVALVPAVARAGGGETPKPKPLAEFGEPGYHVVAYACDACDHAVVAEGCPLCAASGPLRERP